MWDLVVASGQVLRYAFESESGELVEGTYALPEVGVASAVTQTMVMSMVVVVMPVMVVVMVPVMMVVMISPLLCKGFGFLCISLWIKEGGIQNQG